MAQRIQAWCKEHDTSLSALSEKAGRHRTTVQKTIENLEEGMSVGTDVLADIASAMGVTLDWLMYGRAAPVLREARTLEGWNEAALEAIARLGLSAEEVEGAGLVGMPETPPRDQINAFLVEACARVWRTMRSRGGRSLT